MKDVPRSIDYGSLKHLLLPRSPESHKGDFGHVLVVGGDRGMGGAALMAAEAACRVGAGLVSVATHPVHAHGFLARRPELMVRGLESAKDLAGLLERASVIVAGPGLGRSDWSELHLRLVLESQAERPVPLVVDADALNLISTGRYTRFISHLDNWILTPHPGEAGRLLDLDTAAIQADRAAAAKKLQSRYHGVAVLKGAGSLICYRAGARQYIDHCGHGNPGMASGGMGDILSGVIGALLAQHCSLSDAARLGACLHAHAADLAAAGEGERGLLATDLLLWLRKLANPS